MNFIQNYTKTLQELEIALVTANSESKDDVIVSKAKDNEGNIIKIFTQSDKVLFYMEFTHGKITAYEKNKTKKQTFDASVPTSSGWFF